MNEAPDFDPDGRETLRRRLRQPEETVARPEAGAATVSEPPSTVADAAAIAPGLAPTQWQPRAAAPPPCGAAAPAAIAGDEASRPPHDQATVDYRPAELGAGLLTPPAELGAGLLTPPTAGPKVSVVEPTHVRSFGDYELLRELARGGMGVVFLARQVSLHRPVALKMILAGQLADEADVKRFHLEAEAAANLDHPGIVPIYEVGQHEGQHFFSMGFVEGQSLAQKLAGGPLPPCEAAALLVKVAEAVAYAHQHGVIHRDLKPANILLDAHGSPRITDFGLAKNVQGDSGLTGSGQILGTPSYMPPEQAGGNRGAVGPAADVYAMGATLYGMVTGRPPFQAATVVDTVQMVVSQEPVPPRRLNVTIPRDLETIILKCLEKEPRRRYGSAAALAEDLQRFLDGEPILARPVTAFERGLKWARRRPAIATLLAMVGVGWLLPSPLAGQHSAIAALLGLVALVLALGLAGVLWRWRQAVQALHLAEREIQRAQDQAKLAEQRWAEAEARRHETELARAEAEAWPRRPERPQAHSPG
jgi:predicted Ser/Thr protein kinase